MRKNRIYLFILIIVVSCGHANAQVPATVPPTDQHNSISLFNGQDLDQWYMATREPDYKGTINDIFAIEENMIHVYPNQSDGSKQTFAGLFTKKEYKNYRLSLEYKWGQKKFAPRDTFVRDAGVIVHVHGDDTIWPNGIECQIQEGDTGDLWVIGSKASSRVDKTIQNYSPDGSLQTKGDPEQKFHRFHRGYCWERPGWNSVELEVRGDHAKFYVNGHLVNEAIDMKYWDETESVWKPLTSGKIVIQAEGAELYYRNIKIKPL